MSNYTDYLDTLQEFENILNKNDDVSKHQRMFDLEKANPGYHRKKMEEARKQGLTKAKQFLDDVDDVKSPRHAKAMQQFADKFYHDREAVRRFHVRQCMTMNEAEEMELQDEAYTNQIFSVYNMATKNEQDGIYVNRFKEAMRLKHRACGYRGDRAFAELFWSNHQLSEGVPNNPRLKD